MSDFLDKTKDGRVVMNVDELNSAVCDMYDVKRALDKKTMKLPKDNDGTEITIGDCIDDVIDFLESCETAREESDDEAVES